ncbi:MAG: acyltransferase [Candidatus Levybacteria bacterium]|nr:acyltransferase [Candidatus Levybacteria bacterium]
MRFKHIDFLRAVSIIGVIAIHVLYYNLTSKVNIITEMWDYLHFVVTGFVLCSGYVLLRKTDTLETFKGTLGWYKKRLMRLIIPYYVYLIAHIALISLFPNFFSGLGVKANSNYFFQALLFSNSVSIGWLPLLFIQLTILFPFLIFLLRKNLLYIYLIFSLVITFLVTIKPFPLHYFWYMFIPWSLITLLAIYLYNVEKSKLNFSRHLLFLAIAGGVAFAALSFLWISLHKPMYLIDNKYPPNFYYLSYGISVTAIILYIGKFSIFLRKGIISFYTYISKNSYSLYFIHYIVLDFVVSSRKFIGQHGAIIDLTSVVLLSLFISYLINLASKTTKVSIANNS